MTVFLTGDSMLPPRCRDSSGMPEVAIIHPPSIHLYLSNNKQFKMQMKQAVGQDSELNTALNTNKVQ